MAAQTYNARVFSIRNANGTRALDALGNVIAYIAPQDYVHVDGFNPTESYMILRGWARYTGQLSALSPDCLSGTPPDNGGPVWTINAIPTPGNLITPGAEYSVSFYWDQVGTPSGATTLTGISWGALPTWLAGSVSASERKTSFIGTAPANLTSLNLPLVLQQSDGKSTPKSFSPSVSNANVYAYQTYQPANLRLQIQVGTDGNGVPSIQLINTPASYSDHTQYNMDRVSPQNIGGQSYPFSYAYNNLVTGHYDGVIRWLNKTLYFSQDIIAGLPIAAALDLSTQVIEPLPSSNPLKDGDAVFEMVTPTNNFRIIDPAHSNPLSVGEASSLQLQIEQQYSDNSWVITSAARTWLVVGSTSGYASISASGLLSIAPNSITSNKTVSVQATFADLRVVVSDQINVINQPDN